jgi:hypothetical protein
MCKRVIRGVCQIFHIEQFHLQHRTSDPAIYLQGKAAKDRSLNGDRVEAQL